ncbi:MAG: hypothetical protein IPL97_11825 [Niastella sp.]|nr:hypothetical protein [Niastella sp.]
MLKKILILLAIGLPFAGNAQVNITVQLPPAGPVQKSQLWSLVLMNNTERSEEVSLRFDMQDAASGQTVLSGISGTFSIGKGIKIVGQQDIQPLTYNYTAPDFSRDNIPMGAYIICYQVISQDKGQMLGDECVRVNIDPLSPPMLNTPYDKEELLTPYPQFTWIPPAPFDMFSRLNYDLVVAEVMPGQSPQEAVEYNAPIYNRSNLLQAAENYPQGFSKLDTGKLYAWQVVARNGENYAAKTEVWVFSVKGNQIEEIISASPYVKLNQSSSQVSIAHHGMLKMEVNSDVADSNAVFVIRSTPKAGTKSKTFSIKFDIVPGQNFLKYDTKQFGKFGKDEVYQVEYINSKGESLFMKFICIYY